MRKRADTAARQHVNRNRLPHWYEFITRWLTLKNCNLRVSELMYTFTVLSPPSVVIGVNCCPILFPRSTSRADGFKFGYTEMVVDTLAMMAEGHEELTVRSTGS